MSLDWREAADRVATRAGLASTPWMPPTFAASESEPGPGGSVLGARLVASIAHGLAGDRRRMFVRSIGHELARAALLETAAIASCDAETLAAWLDNETRRAGAWTVDELGAVIELAAGCLRRRVAPRAHRAERRLRVRADRVVAELVRFGRAA